MLSLAINPLTVILAVRNQPLQPAAPASLKAASAPRVIPTPTNHNKIQPVRGVLRRGGGGEMLWDWEEAVEDLEYLGC